MTDVREVTDDFLAKWPDLRDLLMLNEQEDGWTFEECR